VLPRIRRILCSVPLEGDSTHLRRV
jgi:hypothetical protein